jgi:hypothetical protein
VELNVAVSMFYLTCSRSLSVSRVIWSATDESSIVGTVRDDHRGQKLETHTLPWSSVI